MPLESTVICLDNSEWMRNGDYTPSRLDAQQDAAGMLINDRLNSNPENTVGILSMAGHGVDTLVSPTEDVGKVLACFSRVKIGGKSDLITAIQIAQLALKHRKNKNGGQRIIAFVGSPLEEQVASLVKVGKQLKKNNVALDVICMGENEGNISKAQELINAANANDNSHLISVDPGVSPVNALLSSPILYGAAMMGGGMGGASANAGDNFDMYGGVDPSLDPELAMAIRISTEESRAHEEARLKAMQESTGTANIPDAIPEEDDEEAMMRRAIELSMQEFSSSNTANANSSTNAPSLSSMGAMDVDDSGNAGEEFDEDAELQRALALSMQSTTTSQPATQTNNNSNNSNPDADLAQLLSGADPNDPLVQAALAQLQQSKEAEEKKSKDKK